MFGMGAAVLIAMQTVPAHWVLAVMSKIQPWQRHGIRETYDETAEAIAYAANTDPIFAGEDGPMRTASLLLAIAFKESRFNPTAIGDNGASYGLFQIAPGTVQYGEGLSGVNGTPYVLTANALLLPRDAALIAIKLIKTSLKVCGEFGWHDRLGWYAQGGQGCGETGRKKSVSRMLLAEKIYAENPLDVEMEAEK